MPVRNKKTNRGTHGDSLLILSELSGLSRKPPPLAKNYPVDDFLLGGGSRSPYDKKNSEVFIPNQEIILEFMRVIKMGGWDGLTQALARSENLLLRTWALDGDAVAEGISVIHDETASLLKYNDENSLTCTVLMAYYSAKAYYMNPIMELPSGKGYADVVYLPKKNEDKPALIVELKWNKSAHGAIRQIKEKQYAAWIEEYVGDILLIGITYHKRKKSHECIIEKYVKSK